jgi:hypothetical protein
MITAQPMNPDYLSDELFHFVGNRRPLDHETNFNTLLKVLRSRCVSANPPQVGQGSIRVRVDREETLLSEKLVSADITCYCDIPCPLLARHTAKYGCFGIGFHRVHLARRGARPVTYVPMTSHDHLSIYGATILQDIQAKFEGFMRHLYDQLPKAEDTHSRFLCSVPETPGDAVMDLHGLLTKDFLAFIKPYDAELSPDDINYFYAEREWRLLGGLKFEHQDLSCVIVKEGYKKRLSDAMPEIRNITEIA